MVSRREGDVSIIDAQYVIATLDGIEHVVEEHRLGLFTFEQYRSAVERWGCATPARRASPGAGCTWGSAARSGG